VVKKKGSGFPSTYRAFRGSGGSWLHKWGELKDSYSSGTSLPHEYYRISENELLEIVNLLEMVPGFVNRVKAEFV